MKSLLCTNQTFIWREIMFVYLSENIIYSHIEQLSSLRSRALDVTQRFLKSLFSFGDGVGQMS